MTSQATPAGRWLGGFPRGPVSPPAQRLQTAMRAFRPSLQWVTFALMLAVVMSVVWSVQAARWTITPPLHLSALIGFTTGAVLPKLRINVLVLQSAAFTLWLLTVVWMFVVFLGFPVGFGGIHQLGEHIGLWLNAAGSGGISTDAVPFAVALVVLTWLLGYVTGWFTFRRSGVWLPVVLAGLGLLTNLSYLPKAFWSYFYLYVFFAMLALAWAGFLDRRKVWEQQRVGHSRAMAAYGMSDALLFGLAALLIAVALPGSFPRPTAFKNAYEVIRWPAEHFGGDLNRLFAGVPAKNPLPYRSFGDTLPFQGSIKLREQVVFVAESSYPTYFRVRSYPTYVSQGWASGETQLVPVDWQYGESPQTLYQQRQPVVQAITLQYSPKQLPVGGLVEESDRVLLGEVPVPPAYTISLADASRDAALPPDVRVAARSLRRLMTAAAQIGASPGPTDARIAAGLPGGLGLVSVQRDSSGRAVSVSLRRKLPQATEVLSVQSPARLLTGDTYVVRTSVSVATAEQLRAAGDDYPGWVRELYLQLPGAVPQRVRDLAQSLTANAQTPYDKAMAIQEYLKTIPYSQSIPAPGYNADGVDHFLFVAKSGYSEYYGSAMAVLLRSVGVPARLAVGYLYGEPADDGTVVERDLNAHGWAEVYFPTYGWVDFEPTPGLSAPGAALLGEDLSGAGIEEGFDMTDVEGDETLLPPIGTAGEGSDVQGGFRLALKLPSRVWFGIIAALIVAGLLLRWTLRWLLATPARTAEVYRKLTRLAALAGLGPWDSQTPHEFGAGLTQRLPQLQPAFATVVQAYSRGRYGQKNLTVEEEREVGNAWRQVRLPLLRQAMGRVGRKGR